MKKSTTPRKHNKTNQGGGISVPNDSKTKMRRLTRSEMPNCPLFDILRTAASTIVPLLTSRETCRLLISCTNGVDHAMREAIAFSAFPLCFEESDVHFKNECYGEWHKLRSFFMQSTWNCGCKWKYPNSTHISVKSGTRSLPRTLTARIHLLEAMQLIHEGVLQHCFKDLRLPTLIPVCMINGILIPVIFSLSMVKEKMKKSNSATAIDTDNVEELTRLLNLAEPDLGDRFFKPRDVTDPITNVVEAHWRGIKVDLESGKTRCGFCGRSAETYLHEQRYRCKNAKGRLQAHCADIYQPLKKFMLQNLKLVRYVKPPQGWNESDFSLQSWCKQQLMIAGFTPAGVLVGVYLVFRTVLQA